MRLAAAGNTEVPAYLVIKSKGYDVEYTEGGQWLADNGRYQFIAEGLIEVLGLITMFEHRGENWCAEDDEIEDFLKRYNML